jgi:hypothetical protein
VLKEQTVFLAQQALKDHLAHKVHKVHRVLLALKV